MAKELEVLKSITSFSDSPSHQLEDNSRSFCDIPQDDVSQDLEFEDSCLSKSNSHVSDNSQLMHHSVDSVDSELLDDGPSISEEGENVIPPDLIDFISPDTFFDEKTFIDKCTAFREFLDSLSDTQNFYCPGCDAYIIEKNMYRKNHHSCPYFKFLNDLEISETDIERFTKFDEDSEKCSLCFIDVQASVVHDPSCANVQQV